MSYVLPDVLAPGLRVVFCGSAAGTKSAQVGAYYAGPGNRFWPTLYAIGLTPRLLAAPEFRNVREYGIGLTDIVKLRAGGDHLLAAGDFDAVGLRAKIEQYQPGFLAFNGKRAAQGFYQHKRLAYGPQDGQVGATQVWILPSTSGAARAFWDVDHWQALANMMQIKHEGKHV